MVMTRSERRRQIAIGIDQSCSTSIRGHGFAPPRKLNATTSVVVSRNRNRQALCTGPISRPVMPPSSMCDARRGCTCLPRLRFLSFFFYIIFSKLNIYSPVLTILSDLGKIFYVVLPVGNS